MCRTRKTNRIADVAVDDHRSQGVHWFQWSEWPAEPLEQLRFELLAQLRPVDVLQFVPHCLDYVVYNVPRVVVVVVVGLLELVEVVLEKSVGDAAEIRIPVGQLSQWSQLSKWTYRMFRMFRRGSRIRYWCISMLLNGQFTISSQCPLLGQIIFIDGGECGRIREFPYKKKRSPFWVDKKNRTSTTRRLNRSQRLLLSSGFDMSLNCFMLMLLLLLSSSGMIEIRIAHRECRRGNGYGRGGRISLCHGDWISGRWWKMTIAVRRGHSIVRLVMH